ncbi:glycosyltransferase [Nostoc sp. UHCC 0702]|nr:glycosyltransferase [Nostoc sp. UHCC 0702]
MKISIITPVYNAVNTLEKTIQSVIEQKLRSQLEYIIIDGGSTDGSIGIVERYLDKIDVFISEKDQGIYDAMNKGICRATGDVIGIINADDWYNDGALGIVEKTFIAEPDISIIYSPINHYINGVYISTFIPGKLDNLIFKFTLHHPSCFVKKSVYERLGLFNISYSMSGDYDFIFRAYTSGEKFHLVDTPLASYSLNGMTGQLKNKLTMIQESSWVASAFVKQSSTNLALKHRLFYLNWLLRELITFPIKYLDPFIIIKIKAVLRRRLGKLSTDQFGSW